MYDDFSSVIKARVLKYLEMTESELSKESSSKITSVAKESGKEAINILQEDIIKSMNSGNTINLSKDLSYISKHIEVSLQSVISEIKKERVSVRDLRGRFYSLVNLKDYLNTNIFNQVKKNMGKGSAKSILNYRTGRFARSVQVDKLLLDKDSSIVAFYTWMKAPYETFSPGFKQGSPTSRDPVKLIDKSIRELAEKKVTNRLKAISK